jgi:hypothetical protein
MKLLTILLLIGMWGNVAWADDQIVTDVGLGTFGTKGSSLSQDKFIKIGLEKELSSPLQERFNLGAWTDSRGAGYTNSLYGGYQLGFEITNDTFQASVWSGPTLITSPDRALGSVFEFNETIFFGVADKKHNSIGLAYNHFSDAGLTQINLGRDYMALEIKFPF